MFAYSTAFGVTLHNLAVPSPPAATRLVHTRFILMVVTLACGAAASDRPRALTDSTAISPNTVVGVSIREQTHLGTPEPRLTVPAGYRATIFAIVPKARFMVLGPDGAVYVSQPGRGRSGGQITRLTDTHGDGRAEMRVAVSGLYMPHGMAFHHGAFYIANTDGVVRTTLDAAGRAIGKPVYLNHYPADGMHFTRTIIFDPDGKMYVSAGSDCNVCVEKDRERAAVMQYDADGSHGRVFASGLRNAVGLAVNPQTKAIWATQNERDELQPNHEDLPPDEINILRDGGDYGWPYCWGGRIPNPEFNDASRCTKTIPPALSIQAHSAVLGITFLDKATQLPANMRGDALVALHGSWDRTVPTGAKVIRIRITDGKPVSAEDFVTGWQRPDGSRWGRPVDVLVDKDGSILISDDLSGEIVRISRSAP
jgi:glucose/arabinose dehydrogenase